MARGSKKDKQRIKRQERRRELHRAASKSPYQRIAERGEIKACYMTRDWREHGMGSIYCLRTQPGGGYALASFLIDFWCLGLKDAWGRLDLAMEEFRDLCTRSKEGGNVLVRIEPERARQVLGAAIRFARDNDFRLPARYERWTALVGEVNSQDADVSDFGKDGKLYYVGPKEDLRQRLLAETLEQFMARPNVHSVMGVGEEMSEDPEADLIDEIVDQTQADVLDQYTAWCFSNRRPPNPDAGEALDLIMEAVEQTDQPLPEDASDAAVRTFIEAMNNRIVQFLAMVPPAEAARLSIAIEDMTEFINSLDGAAAATIFGTDKD